MSIARTLAILGLVGSVACGGSSPTKPAEVGPVLHSRPGTPSLMGNKGKTEFEIAGSVAVAYVPESIQRDQPVGLVLLLHGALRTVETFVDAHRPIADSTRVIVLAPYATYQTWDAIFLEYFGSDITVLDASLDWVFQRWSIDPAKIVISGFSDGATYALGVGRANGDLFARIAAYSPGFLIDVPAQGKPPILISHGNEDAVLSFEYTKNTIVPTLEQLGHTVVFREFTGPHALHLASAREVLNAIRTAP
jgi:phospholipase/carboxylesterase